MRYALIFQILTSKIEVGGTHFETIERRYATKFGEDRWLLESGASWLPSKVWLYEPEKPSPKKSKIKSKNSRTKINPVKTCADLQRAGEVKVKYSLLNEHRR